MRAVRRGSAATSPEQLHQRVIDRIRELAEARAVAISHLPDRAGVARSHFWDVLGGRKSPTLAWLLRIAVALEVEVAELLAERPYSQGSIDIPPRRALAGQPEGSKR